MKRFLFVLVLVLMVASIPLTVSLAMSPVRQPSQLPDLSTLITDALAIFGTLVGWPAFLAGVLAFLIARGVLTSVTAYTISWIANAVVFVGITILVFLGLTGVLSPLDSLFGQLAKLIDLILVIGGFVLAQRNVGHFTRGVLMTFARIQEGALAIGKK